MNAASKVKRYGSFNTWDAAKLLALLLMVIDHIGYFFFPETLMWRAPGRGAAVIFLFLTGYAPSHKIKTDLVLMAALMWIINQFAGGGILPLGILFSIVLGRIMVMALDRGWLKLRRPQEWIALFAFLSPIAAMIFAFGTHGLALVLCGYMQQHPSTASRKMRAVCFICALAVYGFTEGLGLEFNLLQAGVATLTLCTAGTLLWRFRVQLVALPSWTAWSEPALRLLSRYTLWIYVLHFGALQLLLHKGL